MTAFGRRVVVAEAQRLDGWSPPPAPVEADSESGPRMMPFHVAETAFRWLMHAFPARFRRTHGLALFELFRDEAREAYAARGSLGLASCSLAGALDTITSAPGAWRDRRPNATHAPPADRARPGSRSPCCGLAGDVRIAARQLRKAPGFTAVAIADARPSASAPT